MNRSEALEELNDECEDEFVEEAVQHPHIKVSAEVRRIAHRVWKLQQLKGSINFVEARQPDYYDYPPSQRWKKRMRLHRDSYRELTEKWLASTK